MKILHIINDDLSDLAKEIIDLQSQAHEVKIVKLSDKELSYEAVVDDIFSCDRVVSW